MAGCTLTGDQIVYKVRTVPGDEEGKNVKDFPGGKLVLATFDKREALRKCTDRRYVMSAEVVDMDIAKKTALGKLDVLDRLVLGLGS